MFSKSNLISHIHHVLDSLSQPQRSTYLSNKEMNNKIENKKININLDDEIIEKTLIK